MVSGIHWRSILDIFLPRYCVICDHELAATEECICNVCLFRLNMVKWTSADDNPLLRKLWDKQDVEKGGCSLYYRHTSDSHNIFVLLKYRGKPELGRNVARSAFPYWQNLGLADGVDYIIPVPLHWIRHLRRGYNQAEWIAKGISDITDIPVKTNILYRTRNNRTQTHNTGLERAESAIGLFAAKQGKELDGKTVLVVDDILTTGSTMADSIRALREAYPGVRVRVYSLGWSGR